MSAPTAPLQLRGPATESRTVAIDDAMKAALKGDFTALDKIEMDYLNLLVRIGELQVKHADGEVYWWHFKKPSCAASGPFVVAIVRGFARDGRSALKWGIYEKCLRCDGKLRRLPCRVCSGRWYIEDMNDHEIVYTDIDGVLLEDAA